MRITFPCVAVYRTADDPIDQKPNKKKGSTSINQKSSPPYKFIILSHCFKRKQFPDFFYIQYYECPTNEFPLYVWSQQFKDGQNQPLLALLLRHHLMSLQLKEEAYEPVVQESTEQIESKVEQQLEDQGLLRTTSVNPYDRHKDRIAAQGFKRKWFVHDLYLVGQSFYSNWISLADKLTDTERYKIQNITRHGNTIVRLMDLGLEVFYSLNSGFVLPSTNHSRQVQLDHEKYRQLNSRLTELYPKIRKEEQDPDKPHIAGPIVFE